MIRCTVRSGAMLQHRVTADHRIKAAMARWTGPRSRTCLRFMTAMTPAAMAIKPAAALIELTCGISVAWVSGRVNTNNQNKTEAMRIGSGRGYGLVIGGSSFKEPA